MTTGAQVDDRLRDKDTALQFLPTLALVHNVEGIIKGLDLLCHQTVAVLSRRALQLHLRQETAPLR